MTDFTSAYPTVTLTDEKGAAGYGEVTCACGNAFGDAGFSQAGPDGLLSDLALVPGQEALSRETGFSVCNDCGRVFADTDFEDSGDEETPISPVAQYDTSSAEWTRARDIYAWWSLGEPAPEGVQL